MNKPTTFVLSLIGILSIFIGVSTLATSTAHAATQNSGEALEIGPPVLDLTGDPGQTVTANISIRDVSSTNQVVTGIVNDFTASGEDGTPKIITDTSVTTPYSLRTWIPPFAPLTLKPRQIVVLPVKIIIPNNAVPGGHFGVVRFTATAPGLSGSGVSLSASLGALVLLRVSGTVKENISVAEFSANNGGSASSLFEATPITFVDRLNNTGNAYEQPSGSVAVTDMFNQPVVTLGVNQPPHNILPQSIRKFTQVMDSSSLGNKVLFGRYHAVLTVKYGNNQTTTSDFYFWVIPYQIIGLAILILIGGFIGLRFLIIRYNRAIVARATKQKK